MQAGAGRFRAGVLGLLVLAAGPAAAEQYYAAPEIGVELRLEADPDSDGYYLQTQYIDEQGRVRPLLQPLQLRRAVEGVLEGEGWARGAPERVRLRLGPASDSLQWLSPSHLRKGDGRSLAIARSFAVLDPAARLSKAREQFAQADTALNQAYAELRGILAAEDFAEVRANQRRWLKFRDWFVADGDDAGINGPGTVPHLRLQTERTLDRVRFLKGLGQPRSEPQLSGRYSDGMDRELRIRLIPTVDRHAFFSLIAEIPALHDGGGMQPISVAGRASPDAQARSWTASGDGVSANPVVTGDSELLIEPALDFESIWLSSATAPFFTDRLWFVGELQPATEPMREILLRLPASVFDHTTEGLSERSKTPLLLAGYYEPFTLTEAGLDYARLRYPDGQVDIRRYALANGNALIAIATRNVRALQFELWQLDRGDAPARRVELVDQLPSFQRDDFYRDAHDAGDGMVEYALSDQIDEITVDWREAMDERPPEFRFRLYWDGDGFGRYRIEH